MTATATPMFIWYLMRASGLVALVLLSTTVALGVVGVKRWHSVRWPRLVTQGLHRNLSLLAVTFLSIHIASAVLDSWVGLGWIGVVVPFTSRYRPLWVGFGAVTFDLLMAVIVTSLLRRHVGFRVWRLVHWATWLSWPVALAHALGSGTDVFSGIGLALVSASVTVVAVAAGWRLWPQVVKRASALAAPETTGILRQAITSGR